MPRKKIKYEPIDRTVRYDQDQWNIFHSKRDLAKAIANPLNSAGFRFLIYGSIARGDVNLSSDLDIILIDRISSFQVELALEQQEFQILGKEIVQATPGDAIKGHIYLPDTSTLTFFLSEANDVSTDFYKFGGAIDIKMLEEGIRVPGVTKSLTLILPNEEGHREINLVGNEVLAQEILDVHPKILDVRKRVLTKRDKTGRTGVFLKKQIGIEDNFEEELKKIADKNPVIRRKMLRGN